VVIVSHGMTIRLFLMRWFHWTVEEFETLRNPKNAEIIIMEQDANTGKYHLVTELKRKHINPEDAYQWNILGNKPSK
jgi:broad specificity phosphatase PhoE